MQPQDASPSLSLTSSPAVVPTPTINHVQLEDDPAPVEVKEEDTQQASSTEVMLAWHETK